MVQPRRLPSVWILLPTLALLGACDDELGVPRAGRVTETNQAYVLPGGETAAGRVGDYYLRNDLATFIVQRPGRELALGPYGGTLVDVALHGGNDHFGELIPAMALGRTIRVETVKVISDGSGGKPAVIEARGTDVINRYYNVQGVMPDLLSYDPENGGLLAFDPEAPLGLDIRVRYELPVDAAHLSITYTFTNITSKRQGVPLGLLIDSRGHVETFMPGLGFDANLSKSAISGAGLDTILGLEDTTGMAAFVNEEIAVAVVPRRLVAENPPNVVGLTVPFLGGILVFADNVAGAIERPSFRLNPGESAEMQVDVLAAATLQEVLERGWELQKQPLVPVSGCVTSAGEPAPGVRVGFTHSQLGTMAAFTTDASGCFAGRVPEGRYVTIAGASYREPSDQVPLVAPGRVDLELPPIGKLHVDVDTFNELNTTHSGRHPCRLTLVGERTLVAHEGLSNPPIDDAGGVIHRLWHLRTCNQSLDLAPGRYLAFVTRGPEFSRIEKMVEVLPNQTTELSGVLRRVVDSTGYAASDFHVHSVFSPDSAVPARSRVLSIAAEGLDFWASTDHDVVADFQRFIEDTGLTAELLTIPGAEVTTFDTGHFGAYPLEELPGMANGGAPDWSLNASGARPTMAELFAEIHSRGALIQVNHPRTNGVSLGAYFSRAGATFDPQTRAMYADPALQQIDNSYLRYPPGVSYFSDDFDIIEVMNGISTRVQNGMVVDGDVESAGHDWMNLLSAGRRIVGVANSDTHTLSAQPGVPRTMVGGHTFGTAGLTTALARGDALLTTGPMLRVALIDEMGNAAGMGDTLSPSSSSVTLRIYAETPDWYHLNAAEVIANVFFNDVTSAELPPRAVPLIELIPLSLMRPNGGTVLVAAVDIPLDLTAPPFNGEDSWLMVRVGGTDSNIFPVSPSGGGTLVPTGDTPESFLVNRSGKLPYACSNPIFIDMDGDGRWR